MDYKEQILQTRTAHVLAYISAKEKYAAQPVQGPLNELASVYEDEGLGANKSAMRKESMLGFHCFILGRLSTEGAQ